jgi:hypothetical protein
MQKGRTRERQNAIKTERMTGRNSQAMVQMIVFERKLDLDIDRVALLIFIALLRFMTATAVATIFIVSRLIILLTFGGRIDRPLQQGCCGLKMGHGFGDNILRQRVAHQGRRQSRNLHNGISLVGITTNMAQT